MDEWIGYVLLDKGIGSVVLWEVIFSYGIGRATLEVDWEEEVMWVIHSMNYDEQQTEQLRLANQNFTSTATMICFDRAPNASNQTHGIIPSID